jgi:hypothetical protein
MSARLTLSGFSWNMKSGHMTCEVWLKEYIEMQFVDKLVSCHRVSLFEMFAIGTYTNTTTAKTTTA